MAYLTPHWFLGGGWDPKTMHFTKFCDIDTQCISCTIHNKFAIIVGSSMTNRCFRLQGFPKLWCINLWVHSLILVPPGGETICHIRESFVGDAKLIYTFSFTMSSVWKLGHSAPLGAKKFDVFLFLSVCHTS